MNKKIKFFVLAAFVLFACKPKNEQPPVPVGKDSVTQAPAANTGISKGDDPLLLIGKQIIEAGNNENIWNLSSADTVLYNENDHFVSADTKNKLVIMDGMAGGSSGSAHHLLLVFEDTTTAKVIYAAQVGEVDMSTITDLNGDGVKELVITTGSTWMGECNDSFDILNFKAGTKNTVYSSASRSLIGCGQIEDAYNFKKGDTLSNYTTDSIIKNGNRYQVIQKSEILTYNGGKSENEILQKAKKSQQAQTTRL